MISSAVFLVVLAACGDSAASPVASPSDGSATATTSTTTTTTASTTTTTTITETFEIIDVVSAVEYYGACGNETLELNGTVWYPMHDEVLQAARPDDRPVAVRNGISGFAAPRVAPPGPGDDIGTLIVYSDGIARFESDSGWIIWLTDDQQRYGWEC